MIKAAFLSEADFTNAQDDDAALGGMYDPVYEGEDIVEDFEFYIQSKMDEAKKPSMKMKKSAGIV